MLIAMGVAAALCIGLGVYPDALYALLPFAVDYQPYTSAHVLTQLQLLVFSALAFSVLMWHGIYPPELRSVNLDTDFLYRRLGLGVVSTIRNGVTDLGRSLAQSGIATVTGLVGGSSPLFWSRQRREAGHINQYDGAAGDRAAQCLFGDELDLEPSRLNWRRSRHCRQLPR